MDEQIIDWTACDFCPSWRFAVDERGNFLRIIAKYDIPPDYDEAKELPVTEGDVQGLRESRDKWLWLVKLP